MKKYSKGDIVTGYVTGIEKYGFFININNERDGLVHISEISHSYVKNIYDYVTLGELIKAQIIGFSRDGKMRLSIKDLDYRISRKNAKIEETSRGFSTFAVMLDKWIENKTIEITEKNQKSKKNR